MGVTTAEAQVQKDCYKNQTAGNLGVVKLDHLGAQEGCNVVPYGTVWLSKDEATLTARAPADPKDNPFEERIFMFQDAQGVQSEKAMRSLILIDGDGLTPGDDRFVPTASEVEAESGVHEVSLDAAAAAQRDTTTALSGDSPRPVPIVPAAPMLASSAVAAVPPSHARPGAPGETEPAAPEDDLKSSWTDSSERTAEVQVGSLGGSDEAAPGSTPVDEAKAEQVAPPQRPAPLPPVASVDLSSTVEAAPAEETAATLPSGEETGAAETPTGDAPVGEFAAKEEVGSPEAPAAEGKAE